MISPQVSDIFAVLVSSQSNQVLQLRQLLREQFPAAHRNPVSNAAVTPSPEPAASSLTTIDRIEVPAASLTEIVAERFHFGAGLALTQMIRKIAADEPVALIDGRDSFDPLNLEPEIRRRLLWVRCQTAEHAIKAADLLLRDGNLTTVFLDLQLNDRREIRAMPGSCWYRLRNLIETSGVALVVFTSSQITPSAHLRLTLTRRFRLDAMDELRHDLQLQVQARVTRSKARPASLPMEGRLSA